ncbi:sugar phosphate nucleotidyltransferase [Methylobacillus flagellatus]|uniref:sugar phosphate nucleotidyltransferase n=1 Tax=Methylobacillus flagellatus TaxID=405 RepID=UPI0010F80FA7|nr:NDP-sugar synthase [Methylobacillus flagellatus]
MKAMILGAGKGTRVRPITHDIPKPMIPLVRKPVMEYIVALLKQHGVTQIMVNTSHLAPVIEDYFRDGEQFGVQMAYSYEGSFVDGVATGCPLGSAGGMKKIQDFSGFFDETFVVVCGDAWIDLDLTEALRIHREKKAIVSIIIREVPPEEVFKYGVVKLDDDGRILQFQEKPAPEQAVSNMANTGIYIFEPDVLDYIPSATEYDIGGQLFPALASAGKAFYGIVLPFQWLDIGNVQDVWTVTRSILEGEVHGFRMPGSEIRPGVHTGINVSVDFDQVEITPPVYIGGSTQIQPGVKLVGPLVIGANCVVESGALLKDCIVEDYTRVSGLAHLEGKIVFGNKCIDPMDDTVIDIQAADIGFVLDDVRNAVKPHDTAQEIAALMRADPPNHK